MTKILVAITMLVCMASCDYDYPKEVTYNGKNTHGFKLNGEKWVRKSTGFSPSYSRYELESEIIIGDFFCMKEGGSDYPLGYVYFLLSTNKESIKIPANYIFCDLNDSIFLNYETPGYLEPTKCYLKFIYEKEQYEQITYSEVISGKMQLLRFDSLFVGTFEAKLTNGTDTITLTDGKFDYKLTTY